MVGFQLEAIPGKKLRGSSIGRVNAGDKFLSSVDFGNRD